MTATVEQTGLARVRSRASFAYVHLYFRRQAPAGLFLLALCFTAELVRSRLGFSGRAAGLFTFSYTLIPLGVAGMGLAYNASRDRTQANAEYLRSLPLHRGADLLAPVWIGCCWAILIGLLIFLLQWTGAAYWILRLHAANTGGDPVRGSWQVMTWPPLHALGAIWFSFWSTSLVLIADAEVLRSIGRRNARPRSTHFAKNLRLLLIAAPILLFLAPPLLLLRYATSPSGTWSVAPALGLFYLLLGNYLMRRVPEIARQIDLEVLPNGRGARQ